MAWLLIDRILGTSLSEMGFNRLIPPCLGHRPGFSGTGLKKALGIKKRPPRYEGGTDSPFFAADAATPQGLAPCAIQVWISVLIAGLNAFEACAFQCKPLLL